MENGTSQARYLFELDGVTAIRSTEVSGVSLTHEEFELHESNRPNPHIGRGNYKCEKLKVKHGFALNETGSEFFQWLRDYVKGDDVERRSARLIVLDEDGRSPIATFELERCVPISITADNPQAGGKDAMFFSFEIRPEDMDLQ